MSLHLNAILMFHLLKYIKKNACSNIQFFLFLVNRACNWKNVARDRDLEKQNSQESPTQSRGMQRSLMSKANFGFDGPGKQQGRNSNIQI